MDKPEFCWVDDMELQHAMDEFARHRSAELSLYFREYEDTKKWKFTYNEAGDVIRLERVEE